MSKAQEEQVKVEPKDEPQVLEPQGDDSATPIETAKRRIEKARTEIAGGLKAPDGAADGEVVEPAQGGEPDKGAGAPPASEPSVDAAPADESPLKAEMEALKAKNAELTKKLNAADGQRGTELQQLRQQNAELMRQVQELRERGASAPVPAAKPDQAPRDGQEPDFRAMAVEQFKRMPKSFIDKFENEAEVLDYLELQAARDYATRKEAAPQDDIRKDVETVKQYVASESERRFFDEVEAEAAKLGVAGFNETNRADAQWAEFLNQPVVAGAAVTRREVLERPDTTPAAIARVFAEYKGANGGGAKPAAAVPVSGAPARPSVQDQIAPTAGGQTARVQAPKTITRDEYNRIRTEAANGNGDPAKQKKWTDARRMMAEGRVIG